MGPHHFRDKGIEPLHQLASRFIVVPKRGLYQRIRLRIIHVQIASTLITMTAKASERLQRKSQTPNPRHPGNPKIPAGLAF